MFPQIFHPLVTIIFNSLAFIFSTVLKFMFKVLKLANKKANKYK